MYVYEKERKEGNERDEGERGGLYPCAVETVEYEEQGERADHDVRDLLLALDGLHFLDCFVC